MRIFWLFLFIFWVVIIYNPDIIAYLLWWLLVFIWLNLFLFSVFTKNKSGSDNYVKFWNYKIFR